MLRWCQSIHWKSNSSWCIWVLLLSFLFWFSENNALISIFYHVGHKNEIIANVNHLFFFFAARGNEPPYFSSWPSTERRQKAAKTIAIIIFSFFFCFTPTVVFATNVFERESKLVCEWVPFFARNSFGVSSVVIPFICYIRSSRCRSAVKHFLKQLFGTNNYKEKPDCHKKFQVLKISKSMVGDGKTLDVQMKGAQRWKPVFMP